MKKILVMCALAVTVLSGCKKDDEKTEIYTEAQEKVFATFNGTFVDKTFTIGKTPDKIVFGSHYAVPREFFKEDYMNGKTLNFEAQGELSYYEDGSVKVDCYYSVPKHGMALFLYYKGGSKNEKIYEEYKMMEVSSVDKFSLYGDLTLPYIFIRK